MDRINTSEFDKMDFTNLPIITKQFIDKLNEASKLDSIISRYEILNSIYDDYQKLLKNQDDIAMKHLQFAFIYRVLADSLESKAKIELIKQQIKKL
jgi:hypothetical protein